MTDDPNNNFIVEPGVYHVSGRDWFYRIGLEHMDFSAIHENWLGDPYEISGALTGDVVVDVGGNIGAFAIRALKEGAKQVISFEPEPDNIRLFKMNCAQELFDGRVNLVERAVWSTDNEAVLMETAQGASAVQDSGTTWVTTISFDTLLRSFRHIDFLKMDIEGGEVTAINACDMELWKVVDRFAMEYHGITAEWGEMVRRLSGYFDLLLLGHAHPGEYSGGMMYGIKK